MSNFTLKTSIALLLAPTAVMANTSTPHVELDPINITVSRSPQLLSKTPARVAVIGAKEIGQNPALNLNDVLRQDASANIVQSGGIGQTSSIFLRGTNSNHTLVLRDGVRLNSASSGSASSAFLDLTDAERIEVLKGPASVQHGSDAIGGVVQVVSQTPKKTGGFVTGIYSENNTYKAIVGGNLVSENGFYTQIRGQRVESDGTPVKDTFNAPDASYDQKGGGLKVGYKNEKFSISTDYTQNQGNSQYDNFGMPTSQDFKNKILNIKGQFNINDNLSLNARLSKFQEKLEQNDTNYLGQYDFVNTTTKEADVFAVWKPTSQQNILIGTTHQNLDGDVLSYGTPYDENVNSQGYYAQHQFNNHKFNTQLGIRVEDNEKYGTHTVGQGSVRYHFTPNTSSYVNVGSAFRSPTLNELYSSSGNKNLEPEESISYELGLDHYLTDNLTIGISAYRTKVKNLIDADNRTNWVFNNIDEATFAGGELAIKWKKNDYFVETSYNHVKTKNKATKKELSRRPQDNAVITLGLENTQYGLSTSIRATGDYDNSAYDDIEISGRASVDLNGYWNINPNLKVFTNISNVGDVKYATAFGGGSYYINGGRQANIGVTFSY